MSEKEQAHAPQLLPTNHDEAIQLAWLKQSESNLARCYIDMSIQRDRLLEELQNLVKINEDHNAAIAVIIGKPVEWKDTYLDSAREAIKLMEST